jgi:hypothetical protein
MYPLRSIVNDSLGKLSSGVCGRGCGTMGYVGSVVLFSSIHDEIDRGARDANLASSVLREPVV